MRRFFYCTLVIFSLLSAWLVSTASIAEDVNMGTWINVQDGQIVVHWSTGGFDHYNVRWSVNGGNVNQVERDGDKDFRYLGAFQAGALYTVAVQGCSKNFAASSHCTSWDEAKCGTLRAPCTGPIPMPLVSGGKLCLDVNAPEQQKNGGRVQVWACNGSDQQLWSVYDDGRVISLAGKCLDVNLPDIHKDGGTVQVWDCNGGLQQQWRRDGQSLQNLGGKCLDVNLPMLRQNGGRVQVWKCNLAIQQKWFPAETL